MAARVQFTTGFSRRYTGGVREFTVEAKNLRGVIKEMDRLYPGLGEHLVEETTVAIDGAIHETAYFQPNPRRLRDLLHSQTRRRIAQAVSLGRKPARSTDGSKIPGFSRRNRECRRFCPDNGHLAARTVGQIKRLR